MKSYALKILLPFLYLALATSGQLIHDARCFLENGVTAAHLFVSEDLPVGEVLGVLGVIGDPGSQGDIKLTLQEHDSPVAISPYSKNLTLVRPLDKEGVQGPASVYINVICERKHAVDPGFVIPVNIRVTDANDNAPQFVNAPYVLNISEVTVVGTRVLQGVRAVDADQPGPFSTVQYAVLPGPHSDLFVFVNALEGTLVLKKPLDYETLTTFSVGIRAQDQGSPPQSSTTTLYVNVIDADDQNPAFEREEYEITLSRQYKSTLQVHPEPIKAQDQDSGINAPVKYTIQGATLPFLNLNPETAVFTMLRPLHDRELQSPATIIIKATQVDNPDRYALSTIIVSRTDARSIEGGDHSAIRFLRKDHQASVLENTPAGSVLLTAEVNQMNSNLRFWLVGPTEDLDKFTITNSGELILKNSLDYERRVHHTFFIRVTDNHHNDTSRVNVSVQDVNEWEPRFRHPRYEFHANSVSAGTVIGKLEVADGDRDDKIHLSLRGPDARSFKLQENGELVIQRTVEGVNGTLARLVAVATDSGRPPRSSMIPVIVHLPNGGGTTNAGNSARAAAAWLGSSVLLVAIFGATLGLLGVIILVLILYIYKQKRRKTTDSLSSATSYRDKSSIRSGLASGMTPQAQGGSIFQNASTSATHAEALPSSGRRNREPEEEDDHDDDEDDDDEGHEDTDDNANVESRPRRISNVEKDNNNCQAMRSVESSDNDAEHSASAKRLYGKGGPPSIRGLSLHNKHKVAPIGSPPGLSATCNIPNNGGLVENMNDLSAKRNLIVDLHEVSNYSGMEPSRSVTPTWPTSSVTPKIKKLSWDDDDRTVESVVVAPDTKSRNTEQLLNERLNLTVYF